MSREMRAAGLWLRPPLPRSLRAHPRTTQEIEQILQDKIVGKSRGDICMFKDAYLTFGKPVDGVTLDVFMQTLHKLGIAIEYKQAKEMFDGYDSNGDGCLSFYEFIQNVMPKGTLPPARKPKPTLANAHQCSLETKRVCSSHLCV